MRDDRIDRLIVAVYRQAEMDIEDMLIGRKIQGESIERVLDYIASGPMEVSPERFMEMCIAKRMRLSKLKTMPPEWQKYLDYARDL